jgi:chaperonin GroES
MAKTLKVLGARIVVKEFKKEEKTKTGIILPGADKEPTNRGTVISVGEGARFEDGTLCPMLVKPGDDVVYTSFSGSPIDLDGQIFVILNERDILCVIEEEVPAQVVQNDASI